MALAVTLSAEGVPLSAAQEERVRRHLRPLERRLVHRSEPSAYVQLTWHERQRQMAVDLRLQLGSLGGHLVSHRAAQTLDAAMRLAVADVERQLERQQATQRGEPTFGTPSRRLPRRLRPHPPTRRSEGVAPE